MANHQLLSIVPVLLSGLLISTSVLAQTVYSENFRSPSMPGTDGDTPCDDASGGPGTYLFPAGWLLRNVDNRMPDAAVAYVNEAWEVREDFNENPDNCVAYSTSWYAPVGAANDFMWSPLINVPAAGATLSWRARAFDATHPDGYEVRVMTASAGPPTGGTGVIGNQITSSTVVFSTAAEQTSWITRTRSLVAFAGQGIYLGFRNNSNDQFVLAVDDVSVASAAPDVAAQAPLPILPYTRVPQALIYTPTLGVSGSNVGAAALSNVTANAQLVRGAMNVGAPVAASAPIANLASGVTQAVPFGTAPLTINGVGDWSVRYSVSAAETEAPAALANNTITSASVTVTASELARHEGDVDSELGIGAGNGGELGVQFTLPNPATYAGVRFSLGEKSPMVDNGAGGTRPSTWAGIPITASLRSFDTANNKPGAVLDTTVAGTTAFAATVYNLAFSAGPRLLPAGTYVVTVNEPIPASFPTDGSLPLQLHLSRFQRNTTWAIWPTISTGDWVHFEAFGVVFARTPSISLTTSNLLADGFENTPASRTAAAPPLSQAAVRRRNSVPQRSLAKPGGD